MKKQIVVGGTLRDAADRVASVWNDASKGTVAEPQDTITFTSWSALSAVMTDKRHEVLRHLHAKPEPSIRALSRALDRDFRRVHDDVAALLAAGLVEKENGFLHADYSEIKATILLDKPAA